MSALARIGRFLRGSRPRWNGAGSVLVEWRYVDPPGAHWRPIYEAPSASVVPLVTTASKTYGNGRPVLFRAGPNVWFASSGFLRLLSDPDWTYSQESRRWAAARSWPEAWERCQNPLWMLHAASYLVPAGAIARAVVDLVRPALAHVRGAVFDTALARLDRWAQGELAAEAGVAPAELAREAARAEGRPGAAASAAAAVTRAATIPLVESDPEAVDGRLSRVASDAIERVSSIPGASPPTMADAVRARIPLSAVLRGLAGL